MAGERQRHPVTWITDHLAVGPAPMSYAALDDLRSQGVGGILNLCAEFTDLHRIEAGQGFEVYHLPIEDEEAPELAELEKALDWLDEAIYLGKKVFIHCRHGIGRTGTVLNAYILRRGLGHRRAWLRLRTLRAKPANFRQWRMVRRYGKGAVPLTLRPPTLEHKSFLNLEPFFADYQRLVLQVEDACDAQPALLDRCGLTHARCCAEAFDLPLVEAVHLNAGVNASLSRVHRQEAIERSADASKGCPLLRDGACLAFTQRPLRCRLQDLPQAEAARLEAELAPALAKVSREIYQALTGQFLPEGFPRFSVAEAVSGRYVQVFFNWQRKRPQG
ncbi:MAG: dual specificity protein phosphatase family protein [Proteobacteria bacterium]|nr:dual specificity protein phosphatase family protein [Pseudomonadota bacterium]MBU1596307.1 dual specificity protein phosphatase family protein [Pseudomonadota bacterium]